MQTQDLSPSPSRYVWVWETCGTARRLLCQGLPFPAVCDHASSMWSKALGRTGGASARRGQELPAGQEKRVLGGAGTPCRTGPGGQALGGTGVPVCLVTA